MTVAEVVPSFETGGKKWSLVDWIPIYRVLGGHGLGWKMGSLLFKGVLSALDSSINIYESGSTYRKMVWWTDPSQRDGLWTPHALLI